MTRLVGPIVVLLLMLLAGAAWTVFGPLRLPEFARLPTNESPRVATTAPKSEAEPGAGGTTPRAEPAPAEGLLAEFDIARIDPKGTSVFAGRTAPRATVTVLGDGQEVGTTEADEHGEWTMAVDHEFTNDNPDLKVVAKRPSQSKEPSKQHNEIAAGRGPNKNAPTRADIDQRETTAPVAGTANQREPRARQTAGTVTSNLLKNLEGMVESARTAARRQAAVEREPAAPAAEADDTAPTAITAIETSPTVSPPRSSPTVSPANSSPTLPPARSSLTAATARSAGPKAPVTSAAPPLRKTIPVPITFVFNEATLTDEGRKAASLLLEYLQIKKFPKVALTGHADERGSEELNMALSRERLATVERFLRDSGFEGKLELVPKGESEPFAHVERGEYAVEDLYQLDRRVELIITR
jgi:outer membrane protein OmpA-like peptidoglycan-associated protein